jgi:hypothetical protein
MSFSARLSVLKRILLLARRGAGSKIRGQQTDDDKRGEHCPPCAEGRRVATRRRNHVLFRSTDLDNPYYTFQQVTGELGYECHRVSEENAEGRILPEILERIGRCVRARRPDRAASERLLRLGYADRLSKRVIVTAQKGTDLPFDVKDIATIFWEGQNQLREDLRKRIEHVA